MSTEKKIYKDINTKARETIAVSSLKKIDPTIVETTSSGSSIVYISETEDNIYQLFLSSEVCARIVAIMINLIKKGEVKQRILLQKGFGPNKQIFFDRDLIYNPFSYIVPFRFAMLQDDIIAWGKINPLNSDERLLTKQFLEKNMIKICYDISKALYALKSINIIHADCRIDNIGLYKYNFVLFDFDGSGSPQDKNQDFSLDYQTLTKSFEFRGIKLPFQFTSTLSVIQYFSVTFGKTLDESIDELEKLKIFVKV